MNRIVRINMYLNNFLEYLWQFLKDFFSFYKIRRKKTYCSTFCNTLEERILKSVKQRKENHEKDMKVMDERMAWKFGDSKDCWKQTEEEKDFGIFSKVPQEPDKVNRFELLDIDNE